VTFSLLRGRQSLHELTQRFGFRTLESEPRDGVYLNGRKIVLKGVNRHSFNRRHGAHADARAELR
jgi:beta-galactosidase/beta-glucuronidase